jgi:DHA1 family inner membrane transport protein
MTSSVKPGMTRRQAASTSERLPLLGLLTLSGAMFVSMATEFLPSGLIPQISADFGRSPSEVGHMVTVFALTVIATAAPLTVLTRRIPRKAMVLISFALIGVGNIVLVLAPTFEVLLTARILGALGHGAFWSVAAAYPAYLVRPTQLAKAMAITAAGGSVAGVIGTPAGNALGQLFGWRVAFAVLAVLVLVFSLLMVWWLPSVRTGDASASPATSGSVRRDKTAPAVLVICLLILVVVAAQVSFGTYSVVWLLDVGRLPSAGVPVILFVSGVASAVGVAVTGALYRKFPTRMFLASLAVQVVILCAIPPAAAGANSQVAVWILFAVMGAVFGGIPVMLQTRMMQSASVEARSLAAALQTTAFNVGIGGGAFMGGLVIDGLNLEVLPFWAAACMFCALLAAAIWEIYIKGRLKKRKREKVPSHGFHG